MNVHKFYMLAPSITVNFPGELNSHFIGNRGDTCWEGFL